MFHFVTQYCELRNETIRIGKPTIPAFRCVKNQLATRCRSGTIYTCKSVLGICGIKLCTNPKNAFCAPTLQMHFWCTDHTIPFLHHFPNVCSMDHFAVTINVAVNLHRPKRQKPFRINSNHHKFHHKSCFKVGRISAIFDLRYSFCIFYWLVRWQRSEKYCEICGRSATSREWLREGAALIQKRIFGGILGGSNSLRAIFRVCAYVNGRQHLFSPHFPPKVQIRV